MNTRYLFASIQFAVLMLTAVGAAASDAPSLSPRLQQLTAQPGDSLVDVIVFLDNDDVVASLSRVAPSTAIGRDARIKQVTSRLQSFRSSYANNVENYLTAHTDDNITRFWIVPAYHARISTADLDGLANIAGVRLIVENAELILNDPVSVDDAPSLSTSVAFPLEQLNVPALWAQGYKGEGRLVCSFDTGVLGSHPALAGKWRGTHASLSSTWFSKVSPNTGPVDPRGHGTHTMGVMVGSTPADTFGVAPAAEWITAGVIDQSGRTLSATLADILDAFQWALNPDGNAATTDDVPDVILNSWGLPKGLFNPCDQTFSQAIANVEAAGIVTIFAAGNEGPDAKTIRYPADDATTPLSTFSVGAVDATNAIGAFSSRGPSSCDNTAMKPELVAPGVAIRSSYNDGDYKYMTGTSMAAPYIAGLVALMRQYNPDATVEEIKIALVQSARDLGPAGEDNAYGYGLPDASTILTYLDPPVLPEFDLNSVTIDGDGIAFPGEQFGIAVSISRTGDKISTVNGRLEAYNIARAYVWTDLTTFSFAPAATIAAASPSFTATFAPELLNGDSVMFRLILSTADESYVDTASFRLKVGIAPPGRWTTHQTKRIAIAVSDFGQHGLGAGSIYNTGAAGFRIDGGGNLLYEAGIIVGRSANQLSSSIRNEFGGFTESDFVPTDSLATTMLANNDGVHSSATLRDIGSPTQIPILIDQEVTSYTTTEDSGLVIFSYKLTNNTIERLDGLYFGFLFDFDLGSIDNAAYEPSLDMIYQYNGDSYVGLVSLKNMTAASILDNGPTKIGYTRSEQFSLISAPANIQAGTGDMMLLLSSDRIDLGGRGTTDIAFAIIAGRSVDELVEAAVRARVRYDLATDVGSGNNSQLPDDFTLEQNYPNPFNPSTVIAFSLPTATDVKLEIFNTLGQVVRVLNDGVLTAGSYEIEWDGTSDGGSQVASGVYFYRLSSTMQSESRKMVLLK